MKNGRRFASQRGGKLQQPHRFCIAIYTRDGARGDTGLLGRMQERGEPGLWMVKKHRPPPAAVHAGEQSKHDFFRAAKGGSVYIVRYCMQNPDSLK